jgi:hypothetical protein
MRFLPVLCPDWSPTGLFVATLPGPTRRRMAVPYSFRLTYRNPDPARPGCALLWEVDGGRLSYQVALEREEDGGLRWHCTCADAVFRGEDSPHHRCKHVRGLLRMGRPARVPGHPVASPQPPLTDRSRLPRVHLPGA